MSIREFVSLMNRHFTRAEIGALIRSGKEGYEEAMGTPAGRCNFIVYIFMTHLLMDYTENLDVFNDLIVPITGRAFTAQEFAVLVNDMDKRWIHF